MNIWALVRKYFSRTEKWGDPDKINPLLLMLLFMIRDHVGRAIVIHNAYATSGHSERSQHYKGNAADFHLAGVPFVEAIALVEAALKYLDVEDHVGLGIYPDWNDPGFHLDVRGTRPQGPARWSAKYIDTDLPNGGSVITQEYFSYEYGKKYAAEK